VKVDLASYDNRWYSPGAGLAVRLGWYLVNALLFDSWLLPVSGVKRRLLRLFGCQLGEGVVIKPRVNIKYPWRLSLGDHVWIGEGVWIDNLAQVTLGSHVCLSQDALLLTGNHDYKDPRFGLKIGEIALADGVWIGARATVCPGVRVGENCVLSVGSVLTRDAEPGGVYAGNPAQRVRERRIAAA
jgi:putative colanic acid biosynthesis acetyltransferase WcaF